MRRDFRDSRGKQLVWWKILVQVGLWRRIWTQDRKTIGKLRERKQIVSSCSHNCVFSIPVDLKAGFWQRMETEELMNKLIAKRVQKKRRSAFQTQSLSRLWMPNKKLFSAFCDDGGAALSKFRCGEELARAKILCREIGSGASLA